MMRIVSGSNPADGIDEWWFRNASFHSQDRAEHYAVDKGVGLVVDRTWLSVSNVCKILGIGRRGNCRGA